ncbi:interferon regulatory factor 3 [Danio rerio]|uniref:Interferon regulatory factor 3 n=1 Tax=Danio rerio TaxID=7955 RepID=B7SEE0_DANRE|nr:interferon regulatory factor 3 [Danio rerio]ABY91288.1 interferon regulatory factor 3 [Danio rerio]|eukprot:NP_001137376.1 interferon regulatory factor 3 [Danio rerio]
MTQAKPLFVPWLYEQIQSGRYPGVCWKNEDCTQFSIPWKHALRQDSNSDDVLIFKAWAQTSAAGDGRLNGDPSVWKRNFRSALRAKGFKMISDKKNDGADPHKVYQFPSDPHSAVHIILNPNDLYVDPGTQIYDFQAVVPIEAISSSDEGAVGGLGQISPTEGAMAVNHISREYQQTATQPHLGAVPDHTAIPEPNLATFFRIKVYYKGKMVMEQLVENDSGFRLMYHRNMDESGLQDGAGLPVVTLPPAEGMPDQMQTRLTNDILDNLGGLEIRRSDGVIHGHRWGSSRIYWGLCKHERSQTPRELSKNTPQPIYLMKDYISGGRPVNFLAEVDLNKHGCLMVYRSVGLMQFIQTGGESPSCTLYFFLGEKWPDPKMKPWEKKLIMIEVNLTALEFLKSMAVEQGASSLQSDELQLSLEQMMELC